MCYSAQIVADWRTLVRTTRVRISFEDFVALWTRRAEDPSQYRLPKATEAWFADDPVLRPLIDQVHQRQRTALEQELFKQRRRLADAERSLLTKTTKAAAESKRVATTKVEQLVGRLADLGRAQPEPRDTRIFPGWYAPVMVQEGGERLIKPMRYQCRPAGKPAAHDTRFPGTYNARRDSLGGFWNDLFGFSHGVMVVDVFFENVSRTRPDGSTENVVLEFRPSTGEPMLVACLWSRWRAAGMPDLLSFAAITDEPPPEVAAAGHDRCIVPIKPEHLDAWLAPGAGGRAAMQAILDDRPRPYYEHRLAA